MTKIESIDLAIIGIAEYFKLSVLQFSMSDITAQFYYELLDSNSKVLYQGNLIMDELEFANWSADNQYCIDWAASKLGLVLVPEVEEIVEETPEAPVELPE